MAFVAFPDFVLCVLLLLLLLHGGVMDSLWDRLHGALGAPEG